MAQTFTKSINMREWFCQQQKIPVNLSNIKEDQIILKVYLFTQSDKHACTIIKKTENKNMLFKELVLLSHNNSLFYFVHVFVYIYVF